MAGLALIKGEATNSGSTTDRAAVIRALYKTKGWTSRDISVRAEYYSMGSSIHVRIKNPIIPFQVAERIAQGHESIDRDQWGEILCGGNRFVHVSYSHEAAVAIEDRYRATLEATAKQVDAGSDSSLHPIGATGYLLGKGYTGYGYSLWQAGAGHLQSVNDVRHLAVALHSRLAERETYSLEGR